ncbi:MAG: VanW family protein, partial [Rhodospirillaceae bacterium]|nr:VanW family protein [Rhodospirillaceae bacterium]
VRFAAGTELADAPVIAESRTRLWTEASDAERALLAGKIHNLRVALRRLDSVEIPAGRIFGFWAQVGRPTRRRGFVAGRELREGCVIPSVGGGLCQLSNALYDAALKAGFEIVERHAHSQVIPGSLAEVGRDATVFWNYVDLRFRAPVDFRIEIDMDAEHLVLRFRAAAKASAKPPVGANSSPAATGVGKGPNNCLSCNVIQCFRHVPPATRGGGHTAFLLDGFVPEFDGYIGSVRHERDALFIPLDGKRFGKQNYAWTIAGFGRVRTATIATLVRAWKSRRLAGQGAARQRALLDAAERLARSYARRLGHESTHLVIAQNLLPFLWCDGHLKGRSFDVLMTALPMGTLQARLDRAAARHPERRTLADFRADPVLVAAEAAALDRARKIVTAHADIAALFPLKAVQLDWAVPKAVAPVSVAPGKPRLIFPAATLARKGAFDLREAIAGLDITLVVTGAEHEGAEFWRGLDVTHAPFDQALRAGATAVVLPALVEHNPRALLRAAAGHVPVIASRECGVPRMPGVATVAAGDAAALRAAILAVLGHGVAPLSEAA